MKNKKIIFLLLAFITIGVSHAQQKTSLSLNDAVKLAVTQSDQAILADNKVTTKGFETDVVKMNAYPDLKISGQYLRLTNADIHLKSSGSSSDSDSGSGESGGGTPKVNQLMFGQASFSVPVFSGFKLKNSIEASKKIAEAEKANAKHTKEQIAIQVVQYYADLYKVQQSIGLLRESLKSSQQRVVDFTNMEQNGLIARNDLLKAQLASSRRQIALDEAEKNERVINYYLVTLLKLPAETQLQITPDNIDRNVFNTKLNSESDAISNRNDLAALELERQAAESQIKVAKADYYPSLALTGGYVALDIQNVVRVENAMNVGVGLSYNISSIFKNGKAVNAAKSRVKEVEQQQQVLTDEIKEEIVKAGEEYQLSLKQDKVYTEAEEQAAENYRIVKDKYDNGLVDTNDLLDADVDDLTSKINRAYSQANIALKYYELLDANGQLIQSFNLN
ncbi:TolC family protein [Flavobacterium silvaticum]|uniref:TolC family protein n=1 Tax=Flavobacterium silvaticum TaxID=1852020 RepID=A0A972FL44_9FLAO|nr:TolC family protein [Flavobacterium silvaticum]NMH27976.1 TolC family protein [Flavobacterium silvaticum]